MKKHHDVHGGTRKSAFRRRKELALALCVSLWMAGGGVAGAENIYIDENATIQGDAYGATGAVVNSALDTTTTPATKTLSVTGGDWQNSWRIFGGYNSSIDHPAPLHGYTLMLKGVLNPTDVYGAYTMRGYVGTEKKNVLRITGGTKVAANAYGGWSNTGAAANNEVSVTGSESEVVANVYGGYSNGSGTVSGNSVTIENGATVTGSVYGGEAGGVVSGNFVILRNGAKVNVNVYGGYCRQNKEVSGNSVTMENGATVTGDVYGGNRGGNSADVVMGNTLNLSGTSNSVGGIVKNFATINITDAAWGTPVLTLTGNGIVSNGDGTKTKIDASTLTFAKPEAIANGKTMNLIECTNTATITANLAADTTTQAYTPDTGVAGVTVNAALTGSLAISGDKKALTYTTTSNKATKLTFTDVEWKDSGALLDHAATLTNISFNGADVDTTKIHFKNLNSLLDAGKKMTLVSSFGDTVGTITGTKYKVGSTLEGSGKASLVGNDLIFTAETSVESMTVQEQTHNTVMGAEVGMAALSVGNDFVGAATEGLSLASNIGADGVSSFAQMGGGSMRQETGSHIDSHTWNAIIALGHQNKKARGTFEYGAFFEYGSGNYSTFNGDERGDGSMHYTGGGLLAKYTTKDSVYVEGSLRAGSIHDDARNVLRDGAGNPYSYETNAPYMGFHLGVGKEIPLSDGNAVDVYGKYFYNRRNSVDFNAGGHYDLDAVTSSVIRLGARYIVKRDKWNFYAGAAYEHELDGKANGTADGVAIRGADTSGGSFRGELGATMTPGENSPWKLDLNVTGFAGKKQGFTGGVSVAFMF